MLKQLSAASLICIILLSCKKNGDDSGSNTMHFSAKINGVQTNFNSTVLAQVTNDPSQSDYNLYIIGIAGNATNLLPTFDLNINSDAAITTKTYVTKQDQSIWEASGTYVLDGSSSYYNNNTDFTVTITSLTATQVKGTFSGVLTDGPDVKTITDGSFTAVIQ